MEKQSKKKAKKNDDGSVLCRCNVTNFDWTFVPGVRKLSTNHAVKRYFNGDDLFDEIDVAADGNCLFYAFQLFTEWSTIRGQQVSMPAHDEPKTIATFRRLLRQEMQDNVRRDTNCYRGIIGDANQVKMFMRSVYDPRIPDVDHYYNRPRGCLPESDWGTQNTLYVLAHQYSIHRVVIFTWEGVSVASLLHIVDDVWHNQSPEGHFFLDEGFDNNGISMSRVYHHLIHPRNHSNSHYTLYVYFTGNHYHWLKPKNALKMDQHLYTTLVSIDHLQQYHRATQATLNGDNDDHNHGNGDELEASLNSIDTKVMAVTKKAGAPFAATLKTGLTPTDQASLDTTSASKNSEVHPKLPNSLPTAKKKLTSNDISTNRNCIICWDRTADVCCVPCGHVVICQTCNVPTMSHNFDYECPTCGHWIDQMIRIYHS
jgi:hypothetical protein